jgi:hypothetical protein
MREVPLTNGGVALVDDEDYERVMTRRWGKYRLARWHKTYYVRQTNPTAAERRKGVYLHRWLMDAGAGEKVDHRNGDGLDNQRSNLRKTSNAQNLQNRQGLGRNNKTGVRGVCWDTARSTYNATVGVGGKTYNLGRFATLEEAEAAAIAGRLRLHTHSDGR